MSNLPTGCKIEDLPGCSKEAEEYDDWYSEVMRYLEDTEAYEQLQYDSYIMSKLQDMIDNKYYPDADPCTIATEIEQDLIELIKNEEI
jgi:hypothetical protein